MNSTKEALASIAIIIVVMIIGAGAAAGMKYGVAWQATHVINFFLMVSTAVLLKAHFPKFGKTMLILLLTLAPIFFFQMFSPASSYTKQALFEWTIVSFLSISFMAMCVALANVGLVFWDCLSLELKS
jgi:hypothetical protein